MHPAPSEGDVLIAGAGVAAAAAAVRLLACGLRPLLLRVPSRQAPGAEALPGAVLPQLDALGCPELLDRAGAAACDGFESLIGGGPPAVKPGRFYHVERGRLAEAALDLARRRGAGVLDLPRLPRLAVTETTVRAVIGGAEETFVAALDATGRAAAWSRPLRRWGRQVADLYQVPTGPGARGRIVSLAEGWCYRVGAGDHGTVGIVSAGRAITGHVPSEVAAALDVPEGAGEFSVRRPAFAQWALDPVQGRRLAIGDAALACDPVAGQGVRFALASALAAASVILTWVRGSGEARHPASYYADLVAAARDRHLRFLADFYGPHGPPGDSGAPAEGPERLQPVLCFAARTSLGELNVEGLVVPGTALEAPDGGRLRWLGAFDLLLLRELAPQPTPVGELSRRLRHRGVRPDAVHRLLLWCVRHGVLGPPPG
jgi:hypothetical protein